jgi:hypothetical protein
MKFLLTVVFVLPIIQLSHSIGCQTIFPSFAKLSHGIDVTRFELLPEDITTNIGDAGPILDFKCDKHKKWQNPHTKQTYDLPDEIESVTNLAAKMEQKTEIFLNYNDYSKLVKTKCKTDSRGSYCHQFSGLMENFTVHKNVLLAVTADISLFTAKLSLLSAGNAMKIFFDQLLPNNYLENPAKYQEFLTKFGTHFFQTATFGGALGVSTFPNRDYASKHTTEALKTQVNILFMSVTGQGKQITEKTFSNNLQMYYYGGHADLSGKVNFSSWSSSVSNDPWLIAGHLEPITSLFPNGLKKNAVNTAIGVKLDYAYLDELSRSLQFLKKYPKSHINFSVVNNYITQINAERVKPIPPHDRVLQLGAAIEAFFNLEKDKIVSV